MELLHRETPGQIIHVDIFHEPAVVKYQPLAKAMEEALNAYLGFTRKHDDRTPDLLQSYAERIYLETGTGSGTLIDFIAAPELPAKPQPNRAVKIISNSSLTALQLVIWP